MVAASRRSGGGERVRVKPAAVHPTGREHGGRRDHPRPHAGFEVAPHAGAHRLAAAIGLEALEVQAQLAGPPPQVRILQASLVGEQQVVHLPKAALQSRRLGAAQWGHSKSAYSITTGADPEPRTWSSGPGAGTGAERRALKLRAGRTPPPARRRSGWRPAAPPARRPDSSSAPPRRGR